MPLALPEPFRALIFDCDGTLIKTAPAHLNALRQAFALQNHTMDRAWYMARAGLTPRDLLDAHEARLRDETPPGAPPHTPLDRAAYDAVYNQLYLASLHLLEEVAAVAAVARAWHGRVPMAVASNGYRRNVESSLRATSLLPLFDHVVSADDVAHGKPAPDVFLEAARLLNTPPADCVVLEDTDEGLAAAHAAAMRAVDVRPHLHTTA